MVLLQEKLTWLTEWLIGPASFLLSLLATQRLRGGFGVWMRHEDLSDLEFLNLNLLQVVNPKPEG